MAGTFQQGHGLARQAGIRQVVPGARHTDEVRLLEKLVGILPLRDLRQCVGASDEVVEVRVRVFRGQVGQRVNRVGRPTPVDVDA